MEKYIGCSGYYYNHWKGLFYPPDLPKSQWLKYYSGFFNTVEINNTFYRMPDVKTLEQWYSDTPDNFIFSVKGNRFITHRKKLQVDAILTDYLYRFQNLAGELREKNGFLLWQLPGNFRSDAPRFKKFCSMLSKDFNHVFEFRHESWFNEEIYEILMNNKHTLCTVSSPSGLPDTIIMTSVSVYIRFHGEGSWYNDNYSNERLQMWKNKLVSKEPEKLYAYFNNDMNAYAINNGKYFSSLFS
jgi:uncharacterized protein YecE (DUF72 family)